MLTTDDPFIERKINYAENELKMKWKAEVRRATDGQELTWISSRKNWLIGVGDDSWAVDVSVEAGVTKSGSRSWG